MHERSLVNALLAQVAELARRERAVAVRRVRIRVGSFAGVETELFRLALKEARSGPLFADTDYAISDVPLSACCHSCGSHFDVSGFRFQCNDCHSSDVQIIAGDAVILEDVELALS